MARSSHRPAGLPVLDIGWRSLRQAMRRLTRAPGFTLAVLASLVACIGPNVAILSALYALVLKPLPFPHPAQLVTVTNVAEKSGAQVIPSSTPQYVDFRAHADLFSHFAVVGRQGATLDEQTAPVRVAIDLVAGDFFTLFGVQPVAGRFLAAGDEVAGQNHVLVVSSAFWKSHYNADPGVVGRKALLDGEPYTIVGVAPPELAAINANTSFFEPYVPPASKYDPEARFRGDVTLYGRLKPGVPLSAGRAQLAAIENTFETQQASPKLRVFIANAGFRLAVAPLRPGGVVGSTDALWLLQGGALLVLLIGCANVMHLFLARLNARRPDLAVRVALGAGPFALVREALAESALLTGGAAVLGLASGLAVLRVFNVYLPVLIPGAPPVTWDLHVAAIVVGVLAVLALIMGILPVHLLLRTELRVGSSRAASAPRATRRAGAMLVVLQVAVAVVLLVGAMLLIRSFANVIATSPGFDAAHIVQGRIVLPSRYVPRARLADRYHEPRAPLNLGIQRRIVESLQTIPGVDAVAESLDVLLAPNVRPVPFSVRGGLPNGESQPLIHINAVSPEFFAAMGLRLHSGRVFNAGDDFTKNPVAIVDESFARQYFPGRVVEGQEIYLSRGLPMAEDGWPRIVGVVSRANLISRDSHDNLPFVFVPMVGYPTSSFAILVRARRATTDVLHDIQLKLREIDPGIVLSYTGSLQDRFDEMLVARRGVTLLLSAFGSLALLLAGIGLYGVLAYDVSQRRREIGIRGAIGASRAQIVALIVRQGLARTAVGLVLGLIGAAYLTRSLDALLFGVTAADVGSYAAVLLLLAGAATLACWAPARRAARVDPIIALRAQ